MVEGRVRAEGAVPATVGILDGKVVVGKLFYRHETLEQTATLLNGVEATGTFVFSLLVDMTNCGPTRLIGQIELVCYR